MLACDQVLHASSKIDGLIMMSASRIASKDWQLCRTALHGLCTFVSHGRSDPDLSFAAGENLRDFMVSNQAKVTWVPFDQGHEIPLIVWRELRKFIKAIIDSPV
jgi:phospholipase/carboxylesterase